MSQNPEEPSHPTGGPPDDAPPPPPHGGYGAPPPPHAGYGAPPPPHGGYGAPPPSGPGDGYRLGQPAARLSPADERLWAMLAHLSGLLAALIALGFLGPLIVMLVQGDKSPFVRRQAVEALNFQLTLLIATVAAVIVSIVTLGVALLVVIPLGVIVGIAALILIILAAVRSNQGEDYRYPLNWRLVK